MSDVMTLEILRPEPLHMQITLNVDDRIHTKTVRLLPTRLRDEKKWVEAFGDVNVIEKAVSDGDYSFLLAVWVNQLDPGDKAWLHSVLETSDDPTDEKLVDKLMDAPYAPAMAINFARAVSMIRDASAPRGESKKNTAASPPGTKWAYISAAILAGMSTEWAISPLGSLSRFIARLW